MRVTRPTPGTCPTALLAFLCAVVPAGAADRPDTPPPLLEGASAPEATRDAPAGLATAAGETDEMLVEARHDPAALGPLSIGTPDSGLLVNPMAFPEGSFWTIRDPRESWGTEETIGYLTTAIESVEARYPGSPRVVIGDLSNPEGGRLCRDRETARRGATGPP